MSENPQTQSFRLGIPTSSSSDDNFGNIMLKHGEGRIIKPSWDGKENIFRILPGVDPDHNGPEARLDPFRRGSSYGQWFIPITYGYNVGYRQESKTYLLCDPWSNQYDMSSNPLTIMRKAVQRVIREKIPGFNWAYLIQQDRSNMGEEPIPRPKDGFLLRCLVLTQGGKAFRPPMGFMPASPVQFLLLSRSAFHKMVEKFNEKSADYSNNNPYEGFIHQDPTSFAGGLYVSIRRPQAQAGQAAGSIYDQQQNQAGQRDGDSFQSYEVDILPQEPTRPADISAFSHQIVPRLKKWRDVLHIPSHEEQVKYLCDIFGRTVPEVLVYALGDHFRDCIPAAIMQAGQQKLAAVRQAANNAAYGHSYGAPQFGPPQGYPAGGYAQQPPVPPSFFGPPQGVPVQPVAPATYPSYPGVQPQPPQSPFGPPPAPGVGVGFVPPQPAAAPAHHGGVWQLPPEAKSQGFVPPPAHGPGAAAGIWGSPTPVDDQPRGEPTPAGAVLAPPHVANPPELNGTMPAAASPPAAGQVAGSAVAGAEGAAKQLAEMRALMANSPQQPGNSQ